MLRVDRVRRCPVNAVLHPSINIVQPDVDFLELQFQLCGFHHIDSGRSSDA